MSPPLRVIPGGRSGDAPRPRRQPALRDVRDRRHEVIEACRLRVMQAAQASYDQCDLFRPLGAEDFYTFVDRKRGQIFMVFRVKKSEGDQYWKVVGGTDDRPPEQLPRRPDKHEAFLRSRAGTSPEDDELFAEIFSGGPEDYYQK